MLAQLAAWCQAHGAHFVVGVAGSVLGIMLRHWGPALKDWVTGAGTDIIVMKALVAFKNLLTKAGASDEEVKIIEGVAAQVALRAAQDIQKAAGEAQK